MLVNSNSASDVRRHTAASFQALVTPNPNESATKATPRLAVASWKVVEGALKTTTTHEAQEDVAPSSITIQVGSTPTKVPLISTAQIAAAMDILTVNLRGVGPATASLLLSMYAPHQIPFFSRSFYRWAMWSHISGGWKATIKYSKKEYIRFCDQAKDIASHLNGCSMLEIEKAAYTMERLEENESGEGQKKAKPGTPGRASNPKTNGKRKQASVNIANTANEHQERRKRRKP